MESGVSTTWSVGYPGEDVVVNRKHRSNIMREGKAPMQRNSCVYLGEVMCSYGLSDVEVQ